MNLVELKKEFLEKLIETQKKKIKTYRGQVEKEDYKSYKCANEAIDNTFKSESIVLESGLLKRASEIEDGLIELISIESNYRDVTNPSQQSEIGSLIEVVSIEENDEEVTELYFLYKESLDDIEIRGTLIKTISINSPIGMELIHKEIDDDLSCCNREIEIINIA